MPSIFSQRYESLRLCIQYQAVIYLLVLFKLDVLRAKKNLVWFDSLLFTSSFRRKIRKKQTKLKIGVNIFSHQSIHGEYWFKFCPLIMVYLILLARTLFVRCSFKAAEGHTRLVFALDWKGSCSVISCGACLAPAPDQNLRTLWTLSLSLLKTARKIWS